MRMCLPRIIAAWKNRWHPLASMIWKIIAGTLSDAKTYYIRSVSTGKVFSNGGTAANDASVFTEDLDAASTGQKWTLQLTTFGDGSCIIKSAGYPNFAIDVAPSKPSGAFYLVHWSTNAGSANESFQIKPVEGLENTFQLYWRGNETKTVHVVENDRLKLTDEGEAKSKSEEVKSKSEEKNGVDDAKIEAVSEALSKGDEKAEQLVQGLTSRELSKLRSKVKAYS